MIDKKKGMINTKERYLIRYQDLYSESYLG